MVEQSPPFLSIVGPKGSGKTRMIADLIGCLTSRGYRIGAVRYLLDNHRIDKPGSDRDSYHQAGAVCTALAARGELTHFMSTSSFPEQELQLKRMFHDCHLVLIEDCMHAAIDKIEMVPAQETKFLCGDDDRLSAVVGRGRAGVNIPCFQQSDVAGAADFIEQHYLRPVLCAAVLAGGRSSRLGRNKALLELGGATVIERMVGLVSDFAAQVKIITNSPDEYREFSIEMIGDLRPGNGPLSGIHAAVATSACEYVMVVSCDMPLIGPEQVRELTSVYPGNDITIFKHDKTFEPLCAVYRRSCLDALNDLIDHNECRIIDLFPALKVNVIRSAEGTRFRSINTEEDYQYVKQEMGNAADASLLQAANRAR
ncbi:MAG: NTP transferase domain-containing protein [Deltaproteobacteria bacterium]|nr:NTP transferase domain-containing protein [Deltaproteobacteria bacterium]